ncbi:MAG: hypothetical protein ACI9LN_002095, partial [Saprospiraceae bacterium]
MKVFRKKVETIMNFPLKNLEQHLPEMSLILGEQ